MQQFTFKMLKTVSFYVLLILTLTSCKEVFEQGLSNQNVTTLIPQNNSVTSIRNVHFKWKKLEDATSYTLEVVSPSFSNIYYFVVDTTFYSDEIYLDLDPGKNYQWRIRANNNGSKTDFTLPYNLTVDTTSDLTGQTVVLNSPSDNHIINGTNLAFSWNNITSADSYDFIIREGNDIDNGTIFFSNYATTLTSSSVNSLEEKEYIWGVSAKNNIPSITNYATRSFFVDTTHPLIPSTIISPANNSNYPDTANVNFSWINATDIGGTYKSNVTTIIEISTDSLFATIKDTLHSSSNNKNHIFNSVGTYYWRTYTKDGANNESYYNTIKRKITTF